MAQITYQANAVLNAMDEARMDVAIVMVDTGSLPAVFPTREENIAHYADVVGVKDIPYWMEWYGIAPLKVVDM